MSAWIKSYQALRDHPKTRKLARRVGGVPTAIGYLHCLWWWCIDYAPDGDLTKHDIEDIAIACEWDGEPQDIITNLTECGFLENGGGLRVHDWDDYGGALVLQRARNAERMKDARAAHVQRTCGTRAGLDRKKDRKKDLTENRPVDNSTVRPVSAQEPVCWRCSGVITNDDMLDDDKCVLSRKGLRHVECVAP